MAKKIRIIGIISALMFILLTPCVAQKEGSTKNENKSISNYETDNCHLCDVEPPCNTDYYGYKITYDPTTNRTCISGSLKSDCNCKDKNFSFLRQFTYIPNSNSWRRSVPVNEPIMLEITGINPLKYKINVSGTFEDYSGDIGQLIPAAINVIGSGEFSIAGLASAITANSTSANKVDSASDNLYDESIKYELISDFYHDYLSQNKADSLSNKSDSLKVKICEECKTAPSFIEMALKNFKNGKAMEDSLNKISKHCLDNHCTNPTKEKLDSLHKSVMVKIELDSCIKKFQNVIAEYNTLENFYNRLLDCDKLSDAGGAFENLCDKENILRASLGGGVNNSLSMCFKAFIKEEIDCLKTLSKEQYSYKEWGSYITSIVDTINSDTSSIRKSLTKISIVHLPSAYRFNIPMVSGDADAVSFMLNIQPRNDSTLAGGYHLSNQKITISTRNGFHFDFGLGIIFTGTPNPNYYFRNDTIYPSSPAGQHIKAVKTGLDSTLATGQRLTTQNPATKINIGISAQALLLWRLGQYQYIGPAFGLGVTSDANAVGTLGLAYMFGTSHKIAISVGYAVSTVRTPSSYYYTYKAKPTDSTAILFPVGDSNIKYNIGFRNNWFAGIVITFGSTKTQSSQPSSSPSSPAVGNNPSTSPAGGKQGGGGMGNAPSGQGSGQQ